LLIVPSFIAMGANIDLERYSSPFILDFA